MDAKPKRKYTVSEKVVAANRRNLEKANAVPKEIRYRSTPRREAACRQNLRKAASARRAASVPKRRRWGCRSLLSAARQWGQEALEYFLAEEGELKKEEIPEGALGPEKLMRQLAEGFGRWLALARTQVERERAGLLEIWASAHRDAVSAAELGGRLVGLFREGKAFEGVALRLDRIVKMFREPRPDPTRPVGQARQEAPAEGRGDPEEGPAHAPEEKPKDDQAHEDKPEETERSGHGGNKPWTKDDGAEEEDRGSVGSSGKSPAFPPDFEGYRRLVEQSLGTAGAGWKGAAFRATVERIARLSWERHQASEREWERARQALESKLEGGYKLGSSSEMIDQVMEELVGQQWQQARSEAERLEEELEAALREYVYRWHDAHPVFTGMPMPEGEAEDRTEPLGVVVASPPEPSPTAPRSPLSRFGGRGLASIFSSPLPGEGGEPVRPSAANGPERSEGAQGKLREPGEGS